MSKNADAFISPCVHTFIFDEVYELFSIEALNWLSIDQINYAGDGKFLTGDYAGKPPFYALDPRLWLRSNEAYGRFLKLCHKDKLHAIELLAKPNGMTIIAGRRSSFVLKSLRIRNNLIESHGR